MYNFASARESSRMSLIPKPNDMRVEQGKSKMGWCWIEGGGVRRKGRLKRGNVVA